MDTPVGLPDPSTLQAPPPGLPDPKSLQPAKDSQQTFMDNYPGGHNEASAALRASKDLSPILDPGFTVRNIGLVGEKLWGKAKMKATELYDHVSKSVQATQINSEISKLSSRQAFGFDSPDIQKRIDELKKQLPPDEEQIKGIPGALFSQLVGLGLDAETMLGAEPIDPADTKLRQFQTRVGNVLASTLGPFAGAMRLTKRGNEQIIGGAYRAAIDSGMNPTVARVEAFSLAAVNDALNTIQMGAAGTAGERLATKAIAKTLLSKPIIRAGMELVGQGGMAYGMTIANNVVNEAATAASNEWGKTNLPRSSLLDILKKSGIEAVPGAIFGGVLAGASMAAHAFRIAPGSGLETKVTEAIGKAEEASKSEEAQKRSKAVPPEAKDGVPTEPHPIEKATSEKLAAATVGDLVEVPPSVPGREVKSPVVGDQQLTRMIDKAKATHGDITMPGVAKDWHSAVTEQDGEAVLWYNDTKGGTHVVREPVEAKQETPLRMTEAEGEALDRATQSAEGTSDYIEKRPEIERLNTQIEDLQAKVAAGKKEFQAQLDVAKADKVAAVKSLRDQIAARNEANRLRKNILKVDTSEMSDKYKAPIEALRNSFNYSTPTTKTLDTLRDIRDQLAADPEKKFPQEQLDKLSKLDKANWRELTPEDQRLIHDAIMAYKNEWTHEHNVFLGDQRVEKQKAVNDTILAIKRKPSEDTKVLKSESNLTKAAQGVQHAVFDGLTELENMNTGVAMVAGEDSLLMGLQRKIREGHDTKGEWKDRLAKPINDWFQEQGINQRHWFREKTRFEVPSSDPTLHNMADIMRGERLTIWGLAQQEGGRDSILNGIGLRRSSNPDVPVKIEPALLDSILASVTDEEKSFMNDAFKKMTDMAWPELVKSFVKRYGREPTGVEGFYFMIDRMKGYIRGGSDDPFAQQFKDMYGTSVSKAHLTTREASTAPVNVAPIQDLIQDHIQWASNYIGLANPIAEFSKVITDKNVGNAMREKYGNDQIQKKIIMGLNKEAGGYVPTNFLDKFANFFTRRGVTRGLGFNVASSLINRILGVRAATYVRQGYVARGIVYSILHPRKTANLLNSTVQLYREIAQKGASWEMAEAQTKTLAGKVADITFIPLKWGVRKAVQGEMLGGIWDAQDQMEKGSLNDVVRRNTGLTDEDLKPKVDPKTGERKTMPSEEKLLHAGRNAARVTEDTHATVRPYTQSFLSMRGGILHFLTAFNSEMNAGLNTIVRTAMDIARGGNPKALRRLITATVILGITEPTMVALIRKARATATGKKEDWSPTGILKSWGKEELMNAAGFVPTGSDIAYRLEQLMDPKTRRLGIAGRGGVGLLGQNVDATLQIVRDCYQVAGGRNQEKAKLNLIMDIVDEVAGMSAGVSVSREVRNMTGFYKNLKSMAEGMGVDLPELPGGMSK